MKTHLIALTALAALTVVPRPATALGDKEAAILGGILGGVIIGAAIDDALDHDYVAVRYHGDRRDRDWGRHDDRGRGRDRDWGRDRHDRRDGYWTFETVRVWAPKRVTYRYDRWGNRIRHVERGYWSHERRRVWVPARRHGHGW